MLAASIAWLVALKYVVLYPIAVIEGPIISIVAGSLIANGQLDFIPALLIIVAGDVTGDSLYYALGRFGRKGFLDRWGHYVGLTQERMEQVDRHFDNHAGKTLILGKFAFSFETPFLVSAGIAGYSYPRFLLYMIAGALPKSLLWVLVGYFFGFSLAGTKHDLAYVSRVVLAILLTAAVLVVTHILIVRHARKYRSPGSMAYVRWHKRIRKLPKAGLHHAQRLAHSGIQHLQPAVALVHSDKRGRRQTPLPLFTLIVGGALVLAFFAYPAHSYAARKFHAASHAILTAIKRLDPDKNTK